MNMSYCRFQNTDADLDDCWDHFDDNDLSDDEKEARESLINRCIDIAVEYGYKVDREVEEC